MTELSDHDEKCVAGSTATTILITSEEIYCANAGDSRTILSRNGNLEAISTDHNPNSPDELKRIESAGAFVECGRVEG